MEDNINLTAFLNEDLIVEILLRLPVRSLLRFKCVCKSWLYLICCSQFAKSHYDLAAIPSDRILITKSSLLFDDFINSNDLSDESIVSLRLPPHPPISYTRIEFWGSCRGFVLLRYIGTFVKNTSLPFISDLIVWNPSTGEHKQVPHSGSMMKGGDSFYVLGFGYDASRDDYLVFFINFEYRSQYKTQFVLFSFKTNSWNYLQDPYEGKELYKDKFYLSGPGLLFNGALHWLASSFVPVIVAFDLGQRSLLEFPLPFDRDDILNLDLSFGGFLCVSRMNGKRSELWVMKEYKVLTSWTRLFAYANDGQLFESNLFPQRPEEITDKTFELNSCCLTLEQYQGKIYGRNYCCQRLETSNTSTEDIINQQGLCEHLACGGGLVLFRKSLWLPMYRESLLSLPRN